VLSGVAENGNLQIIKGDIRDHEILRAGVADCDAVIHLACISNDPSFELNPELGKSINYDAFVDLVDIAKEYGVGRFIYASSSSVYGVKDDPEVTEDLPLEPLTDYSKYKALCEDVLLNARQPGFTVLIIRPATVCGYSPRQRLDVIVNILTNHAVNNGRIRVFGGEQKRPNIHIEDMADLYVKSLEYPDEMIDGKIYNAGYENQKVNELAEIVRKAVEGNVSVEVVPTDDNRSYHVSSRKIRDELGFEPKHSIEEAIYDLVAAFNSGLLSDPMDDDRYYNIKRMQRIDLK
jgi:nucleoside-diphosphate-sugar epimerase